MKKKDDLDGTMEKIFKQDPAFEKYYLEEAPEFNQAWDIAFQVYDLRHKARLTQKQLAESAGTKLSIIDSIESADYMSYTLTNLEKVAKALNARLKIKVIPPTPDVIADLKRLYSGQ